MFIYPGQVSFSISLAIFETENFFLKSTQGCFSEIYQGEDSDGDIHIFFALRSQGSSENVPYLQTKFSAE